MKINENLLPYPSEGNVQLCQTIRFAVFPHGGSTVN